MTRPDRGSCEVTGCDDPATGSYLHSAREGAVQFAVCAAHVARLQAGSKPAVVMQDDGEGQRRALLAVE